MKFYPNIIHQNAMAFCLSNGVTIIPELLKKNKIRLNVRVEMNGMIKNMVSPKTYTNDELWQVKLIPYIFKSSIIFYVSRHNNLLY